MCVVIVCCDVCVLLFCDVLCVCMVLYDFLNCDVCDCDVCCDDDVWCDEICCCENFDVDFVVCVMIDVVCLCVECLGVGVEYDVIE